jgi:hypothetical protein
MSFAGLGLGLGLEISTFESSAYGDFGPESFLGCAAYLPIPCRVDDLRIIFLVRVTANIYQ